MFQVFIYIPYKYFLSIHLCIQISQNPPRVSASGLFTNLYLKLHQPLLFLLIKKPRLNKAK